jgi:hypothetical protein
MGMLSRLKAKVLASFIVTLICGRLSEEVDGAVAFDAQKTFNIFKRRRK